MIGSKPENSRCEPAQLGKKKKKSTLLPTFVLRLPQGYPSACGGLSIWTAKAIRHIYMYKNTWCPFQSQREQRLKQHKGNLAAWFFSLIIEWLREEILKKKYAWWRWWIYELNQHIFISFTVVYQFITWESKKDLILPPRLQLLCQTLKLDVLDKILILKLLAQKGKNLAKQRKLKSLMSLHGALL